MQFSDDEKMSHQAGRLYTGGFSAYDDLALTIDRGYLNSRKVSLAKPV